MNRFIVKVQISITTSEPVRQALIYNEDKTVFEMFGAPQDLIERVGPSHKRYFWAHIDAKSQLVLDEAAPAQDW